MIDEECLREINDGVFGLRDSLDRRIRQLGDIRRALDATECGLADMQDRNWKMICAVTPARSKGWRRRPGQRG